jgi:hypothetical protein
LTPDPAEVHALFARHYFYLATLVGLGTLQIAVSLGGHRGLWLLPGRMLSRWAGIAFIVAGVLLFQLQPLWVDGPWAAGSVEADSSGRLWGKADWQDLGAARNVNDVHGGLSGTDQAGWFPLGAAIAAAVSLFAGAINRRLFPGRYQPHAGKDAEADGLDALSLMQPWPALRRSWRRFRSELRNDAATMLSRADRWSVTAVMWRRFRR